MAPPFFPGVLLISSLYPGTSFADFHDIRFPVQGDSRPFRRQHGNAISSESVGANFEMYRVFLSMVG